MQKIICFLIFFFAACYTAAANPVQDTIPQQTDYQTLPDATQGCEKTPAKTKVNGVLLPVYNDPKFGEFALQTVSATLYRRIYLTNQLGQYDENY